MKSARIGVFCDSYVLVCFGSTFHTLSCLVSLSLPRLLQRVRCWVILATAVRVGSLGGFRGCYGAFVCHWWGGGGTRIHQREAFWSHLFFFWESSRVESSRVNPVFISCLLRLAFVFTFRFHTYMRPAGHQFHPGGAVAVAPLVSVPPVADVVPLQDGVPAHELPLQHKVGVGFGTRLKCFGC